MSDPETCGPACPGCAAELCPRRNPRPHHAGAAPGRRPRAGRRQGRRRGPGVFVPHHALPPKGGPRIPERQRPRRAAKLCPQRRDQPPWRAGWRTTKRRSAWPAGGGTRPTAEPAALPPVYAAAQDNNTGGDGFAVRPRPFACRCACAGGYPADSGCSRVPSGAKLPLSITVFRWSSTAAISLSSVSRLVTPPDWRQGSSRQSGAPSRRWSPSAGRCPRSPY